MSDTEDSTVASWLAEHPRFVGVLFAVLLALSQAGSVMAGTGNTHPGP